LSSTAGFTIGTSPASESLKRRRKAAASALNRPSVQSYIPFLHLETADFIRDLYERGDHGAKAIDCMPMIQRLSLNLSLTLNWGDRIGSLDDHLFDEITECEEYISRYLSLKSKLIRFRSTTGNLQDYIPILRYSPINKNSAKAVEMRARRDVYLRRLNTELQQRIDAGTDRPCIQGNVLKDPEAKLNEDELISISLTMLSGGLDTITTTLGWAVALLSQRPDIQEKGYKEITKIYGNDISEIWTNPGEEARVPYITGFTREVLRYFTVLRLALPRATQRDVKYEGYVIPEGSTVFLNAWACNMDPEVYQDPHTFSPERFIENPELPIFTYGVGTRMCAGYVLGNRELYIVFLRLLGSFRILPESKEHGVEWDPVKGVTDPTSLVSYPKRFASRFVARDDKKLQKWLSKATIDDKVKA
jgi:3-hydroxyphenylacetate 6-hydroxylase